MDQNFLQAFRQISLQYQTLTTAKKNNNVIVFQNTKLGLPFPAQAPSPTNSTRTWVEHINNSDQPPSNQCAVENQVACHTQATPQTCVTGWLQASKAPKDIAQTLHSSPKLIYCWSLPQAKHMVQLSGNGIWGGKTPKHESLPFLAKYYLYFGFKNYFLRAE